MTPQKDAIPNYPLNDGTQIPAVGFGTYKLNGSRGIAAMKQAISNGYRLLDSAFNYENEGALGQALKQCDLPRAQIRVTSKLPGRHHAYQEAVDTIEESVYRAQVDAFDLYLIHWPNPKVDLYVEAWKALIYAQQQGLVRSIGVCNFLPQHIDTLIRETGVTPCINQIEMHPYFPQAEQRLYNESKGIVTQAWSPLGRANKILEEPSLRQIADAHRRSVGQIILRWHHQLKAIPLPKATGSERQRENLSIFDFELSDQEMNSIAMLSRSDGRTANQDPAVYQEF